MSAGVPGGANGAARGPLRTLRISIPAPAPFINSNGRLHRHKQAEQTRAWRAAGRLASAGTPQFAGHVHILAYINKPKIGGRWDPNNWSGTTKAIVDGLVDSGTLVDDSNRYVTGPDHRVGTKGPDEIILEIIELTEEA